MIIAITGLHGAGKTWFMVHKFGYPAWQSGTEILAYNELLFSPENERITRFYQLSDLYGADNALILFPELQKLLSAESWHSLPGMFRDLLSEHRHSRLNLIGDTQNLMLIDITLRRHISEVYHCRTVMRFPVDQTKLPLIHWISVQRKLQRFDNEGTQVLFKNVGRPTNYFISKLWTKTLYNTFEKLKTEKFMIWTEFVKKRWTVRMVNRELIQSGRVRKR
jgi:Zonular occludens toxin (Zot).